VVIWATGQYYVASSKVLDEQLAALRNWLAACRREARQDL